MIDKDLLKYIKGKRYYLFLLTFLSLCSLVSSVSLTFSLCKAIECIVNNESPWVFIGIGGGFALFFVLFLYIRSLLSTQLGEYVTTKIRDDIYNKYLDKEGRCAYSPSEIAQLTSEGIEQLRLYYTSYLPSFFYAMLAPISLFILFCFIDWRVALIYLVCVPLIPMSIVAVSKWAKKIFNVYWDRYLSLGGRYLDSVSGMKELLIFHYEDKMRKEMKATSEEFRRITMKVLVMQLASTTIMDLVAFGGAAIGIVVTLVSMSSGNITPFLALFMCLVGAEFFIPMRTLGSAFHVAMNGATSGKKVISLLNEKAKEPGTLKIDSISSIRLKNLSFAYPDSKEKVLKDINLDLGKGFSSLIGISGSGKSTLASILSSSLSDYEGSITINDAYELRDIEPASYHRGMSLLSSSSYLLHQSIKDSFAFYGEADEEKMWSLLEEVSLKERIEDAGGLSYIPKEGGSDLSGGEKQRLLLAYYLAKGKSFYIFDEATSSIDKESEAIIMKKIKELSNESVVLVITHRLQNALLGEKVYTLKNGQIVEEGSPDELVKKGGEFSSSLALERKMEVIA